MSECAARIERLAHSHLASREIRTGFSLGLRQFRRWALEDREGDSLVQQPVQSATSGSTRSVDRTCSHRTCRLRKTSVLPSATKRNSAWTRIISFHPVMGFNANQGNHCIDCGGDAGRITNIEADTTMRLLTFGLR